jgi:GDPmannose 4,6-dehydratase
MKSFVGASFEQSLAAGEITGLGTTRVLEVIRFINTEIKFYQASTSEIYGNSYNGKSLNENDISSQQALMQQQSYTAIGLPKYREGCGILLAMEYYLIMKAH